MTAAAARIRTRRRATDEAVQPVPFDPEHHLMHPFAVLVTGLR